MGSGFRVPCSELPNVGACPNPDTQLDHQIRTPYYETDRALSEYLLFHYGAPEQLLPYAFGPTDALNFPGRCVTECLSVTRLPSQARALDLGCAVGRSSFELARSCAQVVG